MGKNFVFFDFEKNLKRSCIVDCNVRDTLPVMVGDDIVVFMGTNADGSVVYALTISTGSVQQILKVPHNYNHLCKYQSYLFVINRLETNMMPYSINTDTFYVAQFSYFLYPDEVNNKIYFVDQGKVLELYTNKEKATIPKNQKLVGVLDGDLLFNDGPRIKFKEKYFTPPYHELTWYKKTIRTWDNGNPIFIVNHQLVRIGNKDDRHIIYGEGRFLMVNTSSGFKLFDGFSVRDWTGARPYLTDNKILISSDKVLNLETNISQPLPASPFIFYSEEISERKTVVKRDNEIYLAQIADEQP